MQTATATGRTRRPAPFTGVGVALVTLFHDDGSLDASSTARLAATLVEHGVRAVVVAGSTGEAKTLDPSERSELLAAVRGAVAPGTVPVIAGTGAPSAQEAAELTRRAVDGGADAVLALSPPGSSDLAGYYGAVDAAAGEVAVLGYHFPAMSEPGIPLEQLGALAIDGCKDSSRDSSRLLVSLGMSDLPLYSGSAANLALAGPLGATGAILALANAEPERCVEAFGGDVEAQRSLWRAEARSSASFPAGIKALTAERFSTPLACRA